MGAPHIGHAYERIATDAFARFNRLDGRDTLFVTGMDEHGLKMQQTAAREGLTPQALADRTAAQFEAMGEKLNARADDVVRTTQSRHKAASQEIWRRMAARGDIYLSKYSGWYSVRDEAYYDADELTENSEGKKFAPTGTPVEWVEEESYFFRLSAYQDRLLAHYEAHPDFITPEKYKNEIVAFVKRGLKDLSVSRTTFDWGVPVPGDDRHVMYVWVDALTNYLTGTGFPEPGERGKFWPADAHVIGKDITRFHAVFWPAFLMSADIPLPKQIVVHGFLFNRGEKMSKSVGNVIDPFTLADHYGVDALRYFFLREVPFGQDGNYSHEAIVQRINADLANDLGNLAQRSLSMIAKNCGGSCAGAGRERRGRRRLVDAGLRHPRRRARRDARLCPAHGARGDLGGGGGDQSLFRRTGAVEARQDRSGAARQRALCHRRDAARHCAPVPALYSRSGVPAARSAGSQSRRARFRLRDAGTSAVRRRATAGAGADLSALCRAGGSIRMRLIDTHCHLDFPELAKDRAGVLARAAAAGVARMITISTEVEKFPSIRAIAESADNIYCSVGTHPNHAHEEREFSADELAALAAHPKCVAIGETGLDYHYNRAPRDLAHRVFRAHIGAARKTGLPLVIHSRDADADMAAILTEEMAAGPFKALLHCFTSGRELAESALALGAYISFSGVVTFKNSGALREIAEIVPLDRMLVETDAPFLAPTPHRGKTNEPAYVADTARLLAGVKGIEPDALGEITTRKCLAIIR